MTQRLLAHKLDTCALALLAVVALAGSVEIAGAQAPASKPDSAQPATAQPPPTTVPQGGTSAVVMDLSAIESVIGKSVKSSSGEDLGRIVDLLVTTTGQVRAAVIDFGGVLGVGSRKVAVDWKAMNFATFTKEGTVTLALTRNQVRVSPEYKSGDPVVILQATKPEDIKPTAAADAPPVVKTAKPAAAPEAAQSDAHQK